MQDTCNNCLRSKKRNKTLLQAKLYKHEFHKIILVTLRIKIFMGKQKANQNLQSKFHRVKFYPFRLALSKVCKKENFESMYQYSFDSF